MGFTATDVDKMSFFQFAAQCLGAGSKEPEVDDMRLREMGIEGF